MNFVEARGTSLLSPYRPPAPLVITGVTNVDRGHFHLIEQYYEKGPSGSRAASLSLQIQSDKGKDKDFMVLLYLYYVSDSNFVNIPW